MEAFSDDLNNIAKFKNVDSQNNLYKKSKNEHRTPEAIFLASSNVGISTVQQFSDLEDNLIETETLKRYGLTEEEMQIYQNVKKGSGYIKSVHKNVESSVFDGRVQSVMEKIQAAKNGTVGYDTPSGFKTTYSIDPNFQVKEKFLDHIIRPADHPMNHLDDLKDDLFGHMDMSDIPSTSKRRKLLRRMDRKLAKESAIPEPKVTISDVLSKNPETHSYNNFVKSAPSFSNKLPKLNKNSKWDIKDVSELSKNKKASDNNMSIHKVKTNTEKIVTVKSDPSKTLYTIKNNKIVRLESKDGGKKTNGGKDLKMDNYRTVEIKLPINKAEEKLLEGTKLSIEDIKKIPKFENYVRGQPSKILFVKNLSNSLNREDLMDFLIKQHIDAEDIRLMTGRMKGQAFITFTTPEMSGSALDTLNGIILKGKPVIVQFGKKENG